jgi:hypothetical protein
VESLYLGLERGWGAAAMFELELGQCFLLTLILLKRKILNVIIDPLILKLVNFDLFVEFLYLK